MFAIKNVTVTVDSESVLFVNDIFENHVEYSIICSKRGEDQISRTFNSFK